jgi:hypothetical protein
VNIPAVAQAKDLLEPIGAVERSIEQSRRFGAVGRILVVGAVVVQAALLALIPLGVNVRSLWVILVVIPLAAGLTLLLLRRAWIREAREPFRYTFWVAPFERLAPEGAASGSIDLSLLGWLTTDLREKMSERIRRLALLDDAHVAGADAARLAHVNIRGHYTWRDGPQEIEVRAWVRIGPPGCPETFAHPIQYRKDRLDQDDYDQILERVYFSVTSAVYGEIRDSVERKIVLLPRGRLRAAAYFWEAEDYACSNTLDAYADAGRLYQKAIDEYERGFGPTTRLRRRLARRSARAGRSEVLRARAHTGRARVLLYHSSLSSVSGQRPPAVFEARPAAENATKLLESLPVDVEGRTEALFDAYTTLAHAWAQLDAPDRARNNLRAARALAPQQAEQDADFMFVTALLEPQLIGSLQWIRAALELDVKRRLHAVELQLALRTEYLWRTRPTLEKGVGNLVIEQYRSVIKRNPGVVAAWASLGYVFWLLERPDDARNALGRGRQYKDIKRDTFVSELDYGLARVAAEEGSFETAYQHYVDAVSAFLAREIDPSAAYAQYYFRFIGPPLMERFDRYADRVERLVEQRRELVPDRIRDSVLAFVYNDHGEACWFYGVRSGDERRLFQAWRLFERAAELNPRFPLPHWNLYGLGVWLGRLDAGYRDAAQRALGEVRRLAPSWQDAIFAQADLVGSLLAEARAKQDEAWAIRELDSLSQRARPDARDRADTLSEQASTERLRHEGELLEALPLITGILPHRWFADIWSTSHRRASTAGVGANEVAHVQATKLLKLLERPDINWARDLNALHVAALSTWVYLLVSASEDPEVQLAAAALTIHTQEHYFRNRGFELLAHTVPELLKNPPPGHEDAVRRLGDYVECRWREAVDHATGHQGPLPALIVHLGTSGKIGLHIAAKPHLLQRACTVLSWRALLWEYERDRAHLYWTAGLAHELVRGFPDQSSLPAKMVGFPDEAFAIYSTAADDARDPTFVANAARGIFELTVGHADDADRRLRTSAELYARALGQLAGDRRSEHLLNFAVVIWTLATVTPAPGDNGGSPTVPTWAEAATVLDEVARDPGRLGASWRRRLVRDLVENVLPAFPSQEGERELSRWLARQANGRGPRLGRCARKDARRALRELAAASAPVGDGEGEG